MHFQILFLRVVVSKVQHKRYKKRKTEKYTECSVVTQVNKLSEMSKCVGMKKYAEKVPD